SRCLAPCQRKERRTVQIWLARQKRTKRLGKTPKPWRPHKHAVQSCCPGKEICGILNRRKSFKKGEGAGENDQRDGYQKGCRPAGRCERNDRLLCIEQ